MLVAALLLIPTAGALKPAEPLFSGLGSHHRKVSTSSARAQRYFDQGLDFLFAFNHDEAIRSFKQAADLDPKCAMAYWGIATASGPHINNPIVDDSHSRQALKALSTAGMVVRKSAPEERQLIDAARTRFADPNPKDRAPLDLAYANAMRKVWKAHPRDPDVGAMFAESMMDLRPWDLWKPDGSPQPGTPEILATLKAVIAEAPTHPLGNHLYIHAVEGSPHPELGMRAANLLRNLEPGLGHMVHMPSHIDVRTGGWKKAVAANLRAIAVDNDYRHKHPNQGFYSVYMAHNRHMLGYASMMRGQASQAIRAMDTITAIFPAAWLKENAPVVDGFMIMPIEVRVRFGKWRDVLAQPAPKPYFPLSVALAHSARAVAYAALGDVPSASHEKELFETARGRVPADSMFGNNTGAKMLEIAGHLMNGEILVRQGDKKAGIAELRAAVRAEDSARYDEPPDWIQPTRHTLGAALMDAGRYREAAQVYRDDLKKLPGNGWSLYGLSRALRAQGKSKDAARFERRFRGVWADADTKIDSSCLCLPSR